MLYVRGQSGQAAIRIRFERETDSLVCTVLNDQSKVVIDRSTDATFLAGLRALDARVVALVGQPTILSDIVELV